MMRITASFVILVALGCSDSTRSANPAPDPEPMVTAPVAEADAGAAMTADDVPAVTVQVEADAGPVVGP